MSETTGEIEVAANEETLKLVEHLTEALDVANIQVTDLAGSLPYDSPQKFEEVRLDIAPPQFRIYDQRNLACRLRYDVELINHRGKVIARVGPTLIVNLEPHDDIAPLLPDRQAVALYLKRTVFYIAHPYFREAIQSMTQKLGLSPVTLGVLPHNEGAPIGVTVLTLGSPTDRRWTGRNTG